MKTLLTISILLVITVFHLFADDIFLRNGRIIKNCQIIDTVDSRVRYKTTLGVATVRLTSISTIVSSPFDPLLKTTFEDSFSHTQEKEYPVSNHMREETFGGGLELGCNFMNAETNEPDVSTNPKKIDFVVGIYLNYVLSGLFSLQPEILYIRKGTFSDITFRDATGRIIKQSSADFQFNYIEIPVLIRMDFPFKKGYGLYFFAGPNLGINLSSKYVYQEMHMSGYIPSGPYDVPVDIGDKTKSIDFSLDYGIGLKFTNFNISVRQSQDLMNIDKEPNISWKLNGIQIMIDYSSW